MKKYMNEYIENIKNKLNGKIKESDIEELKTKISFFSHERLIHLIVTMFFALFTLIFIYFSLVFKSYIYIVLSLLLLIILIFYILHYYFLENAVQYLYKLYDQMKEKQK